MRIIDNAITTLVGKELGGDSKWKGTLAAPNGSLYGIPFSARRVVKFNPIDKSMTHIGPDLRSIRKWINGAMTDNGVIYCPPCNPRRGILKIDTNTDNVTELNVNLLPQQGLYLWHSCALALDGCLYFMPDSAICIMKIDPNNGDSMSFVGNVLEGGVHKYYGTVVGIDGCVYGIPYYSNRIVKYDPINVIISFVGKKANKNFYCGGNGALGRDGCIYAADKNGRVLKIDTTNNSHCFVGKTIEWWGPDEFGWRDGILGIDGCIYWPPVNACRTLKYDPHSNLTSLVGDDFGTRVQSKWSGGCTAPDGIIYCLPDRANRILSIDPLKEWISSLKSNMEQFPEKLGCIFHSSDDIPDDTNFDRAVTKFGLSKVLDMLDECMPPADQACTVSNLYPFMIAASYKHSNLSAIYHVLRQVPSLASASIITTTCKNTQSNKKRKQRSIS